MGRIEDVQRYNIDNCEPVMNDYDDGAYVYYCAVESIIKELEADVAFYRDQSNINFGEALLENARAEHLEAKVLALENALANWTSWRVDEKGIWNKGVLIYKPV